MLLRQDFCRRHYTCLKTVSYGYESRKDGHHRLSAADISLKEAVHLVAALHVVPDLCDHPFLSPGKGEGERFVAFVEGLSDLRHMDALFCAAAYIFLFQE